MWKSTFDSTPDGVVDIKDGNSIKTMIGPVANGQLQITTMDSGTDAYTPDKAGRPLGVTVGPANSFSGLYQFNWSTLNQTETQAYEAVGFLGNAAPQTRQVLGAVLRHWRVTNTTDYYVGVDLAFGSVGFTGFGYSGGPSTYLGASNPEGNTYQLAIGYDGTTQTLNAGLYDATGTPLVERTGTLSGILPGSDTAKQSEINAMSLTHLGWEDYSGNLTDQPTVWQNDTLSYFDTADGAKNAISNLLAKSWNVDADGNWSVATNWNPPGEANGAGAAAVFGSVIMTPRTVSVDNADKTVGTLVFDNTNSYTIAGPFALLLNSPSGTGTITVSSGSHVISAPITVASTVSNVAVNVAQPTSTLTISGSIAESGVTGLSKDGGGKLVLSGPLSYTGNTTVTAGTLSLATNLTTSAAVAVNGGTLELAAGGGSTRVLQTPALSVAPGAKIDVQDNKIITGSAIGTLAGGTYTGVTGLIQSGRNGGDWAGSGIVTSLAANNADYTSLGVASGADVKGLSGTATDTWGGQTVHAGDTLVMYTYGGDANLDGVINIDDYTQIDSSVSVGGALKGWFNGDFNYDGDVNIDDYTIIDSNIGIQGAPFPTGAGVAASAVAVPEPGLAGLTVAATFAASGGRRRRRPGRAH